MATYDAPALWTDATYTCPDCVRAGKPDPQPTSAFYYYRVKSRNEAWRRSAYCKPHQRARYHAWRKAHALTAAQPTPAPPKSPRSNQG